ncbi:MAG: CHAT domain-containing protein, partial [Myxococcota bacterium]
MTPNNTLAPTFDVTVDDTSRLLVRWSDRPHREARTLSEADRQRIDEHVTALGQAEAQGHDVLPAAHRLGTALFAVMDGPDRRLARMMANSKQSGRPGRWVIRLCGARNLAQHPATHWRWELVHDGQRYLAVDDDVTVQLDSAHTSSPQVLPHRGLRVLFMAYSPEGCEPVLDYELEEDRVLGALQEALRRRRTSVVVAEDGTLAELERRLKASAHDVLHLTGHGVLTPEGPRLLMEDEEGRADLVSPEALLRVLRKGHMPALVMISSCHSAGRRGDIPSFAAELVAGGVPSVIGWVQPVRDDVATEAASHLYERLCMGDTPTQAVRHTRRVLQDLDQGNPRPSHAWATFHLLTRDAQGFVLDAQQPELSARLSGQEQTYRYLGAGGRMRVLEKGFVGRRRELQRAIRILRHGKDHDQPVAGLTILGMKGVGKSCLAARALERHVQDYTDVGLVVLHGHLDDAMMLEAFEKLALQWDDTNAQAKLGGTDDVLTRLKRLLGGIWRDRPMVIVLDDFEQNLEEQGAEGAARLKPYTADVLKMLLPICRGGAPKLMLTTTASFEPLADEERALAEVPLGPFARAATRKLWSRGVARELKNISAGAWDTLAERLGRNARVLDWARTLLAGRTPEEVAQIHQKAVDALPKWKTSEVPSSDEQKQLAETFLRTLAYDRAKALVGADALTFVKRARVYKVAVSMEALAPLADGLSVNLEHHLVALQNLGLMEVGRLDGRRAHRVSPLVEPEFKAAKSDRWHRVAADFWWSRSKDRGLSFEQLEMGWEHALAAEDEP